MTFETAALEPVPPYDVELEQAILGAMLVDNRLFDAAQAILTAEHFYDPMHRRIYATLAEQARTGTVTPLTLWTAMRGDPGLLEVGGREYLAGIAGAAPALPAIRRLAAMLIDLHTRRTMIRLGEQLVDAGRSDLSPKEVDAYLDRFSGELQTARSGAVGQYTMRPFSVYLEQAVHLAEWAHRAPAEAYLSWGLKTLDDILGPLFRGDLDILGGATSMAKTALAEHVWHHNGGVGHPSIFYSLEMPGAQLAMRAQAKAIRAPANHIRKGKLSTQEFEALVLRGHDLGKPPLYVDDRAGLTVPQMRAKAQAIKRKHGSLGLVVVDHLQYVGATDARAEERDQLREITRELKDMAKALNCVVLLLSHITKANEAKVNKRPTLSDLYGSVGIQQNADMVAFIYREHFYLSRTRMDDEKAEGIRLTRTQNAEGWAEVYTDKNRMGKVDSARVRFDDQFTEFSDPEPPKPPPALLPNLAHELQNPA